MFNDKDDKDAQDAQYEDPGQALQREIKDLFGSPDDDTAEDE